MVVVILIIILIGLYFMFRQENEPEPIVKKPINSGTMTSSPKGNIYDELTHMQKLAAMRLMFAFGGACDGNPVAIEKINHIMTVEGGKMGISGNEVRSAGNLFSGMKDMARTLTGISYPVKESLFIAMYCIVAACKDKQAVTVLLGVFNDIGLSESECLEILQKKTGRI